MNADANLQNSEISFTLNSSGSDANVNPNVLNNVSDDRNSKNCRHRHRHHKNPPNESSSTSSSSSSQFLINNNNTFDIHLAQIDIETFKSEDIRKIPFNQHSMMNASNDDTLRYFSENYFTFSTGFFF